MNCSKKKYRIFEPLDQSVDQNNVAYRCEETIDILKFEQEELLKMFNVVSDKKHCLCSQINRIEKEDRALKGENDELEYFLSEKQKIIKQLRQLLVILKEQKQLIDIDALYHSDFYICQTFSPHQQRTGEDMIRSIQETNNQIIYFKGLLSDIQKRTLELSQSGALWNCSRCQIELREGYNEETCIHHSGKLKYYSCKTCGGDEYFTCCQQCRECNKGCKTGLHKP